jgi:hypothetical protein
LGIVELSIHGGRRRCSLKYTRVFLGIQSTRENTTCKIADVLDLKDGLQKEVEWQSALKINLY